MTILVLLTAWLPNMTKSANAETPGNTAILRIMETTDLHANIMPYDYYKDTDEGIDYGLAKTASLIRKARSEVHNSMLFDAGDLIQGNPLAHYVAKVDRLGKNEVHPIIGAMHELAYDAGTVGNHEFNYGLEYLQDVVEEAQLPIVNANIYKDDHDSDYDNDVNYFPPYEILDKKIVDDQGNSSILQIGVIGFVPPQIMNWDHSHLSGKVIVKDIVETARLYIPKMKEEGADIIIAIAHSGLAVEETGNRLTENAVYDLAKIPGIDVILFGHAHLTFPGDSSFDSMKGIDNVNGTIHDVPAVEAGRWGNRLGIVDLKLIQDKTGKWSIDKSKSRSANLPVTENTPLDPAIVKIGKKYHKATIKYVRQEIGKTATPIHSYFSRVMDSSSVQIVNDAQRAYANEWIKSRAPELKELPIISAAAPFKGGRGGTSDFTDIKEGELTIKSANDLYIFDNTLMGVKMTGAEVKEWLEYSASQYQTIDPEQSRPQELLDYQFSPFNFDVIDGIRYEIDVTQPRRYNWENGMLENPAARRIINFTMMDGTPIKDEQEFIVVTNNYRAGGGGNLPGVKDAEVVIDSSRENREIIIDYIQKQVMITPVSDQNWRIAPIKGDVTLIFQSSPDALKYLEQTPAIKDLGPSQTIDGFQTYQLISDK